MPKSICVDLNIIIDFLLKRRGFAAANRLFERGDAGAYKMVVSAHCVTTLAYLLEKNGGTSDEIESALRWLLAHFTVQTISRDLLVRALTSPIADFEDAVVEQAALTAGCVVVATRNLKDFVSSAVPALTPEALLAR